MCQKYAIMSFDVERDRRLGRILEETSFEMSLRAIGRLAEIAESHDVRCTFFVTGEAAIECKELLKSIARSGHEIASHTHPYLHPDIFKGGTASGKIFDDLTKYTLKQQFEMIKKDTETIRSELGITPCSFRAARLSANRDTLSALTELQYEVDSSFRLEDERFLSGRILSDSIRELPLAIWISPKWFSGLIGKTRFLIRSRRAHKLMDAKTHTLVVGAHSWDFGDPGLKTERFFEFLEWVFNYWKKNAYEIVPMSRFHLDRTKS